MIISLLFCFNVFVSNTLAAGLWDNISCKESGNCQLNDFVQIGINVANMILGIVGGLALLMFIYGGVMMIISAGKSEQTEKAKSILKNAIIGIIIVFAAWTIISFTYKAFQAANQTWYQAP